MTIASSDAGRRAARAADAAFPCAAQDGPAGITEPRVFAPFDPAATCSAAARR